LAANVGEEIKQKILTRDTTINKKEVISLATMEPEQQRKQAFDLWLALHRRRLLRSWGGMIVWLEKFYRTKATKAQLVAMMAVSQRRVARWKVLIVRTFHSYPVFGSR
jgi:hypothetical protein